MNETSLARLSPSEWRVLLALCRFKDGATTEELSTVLPELGLANLGVLLGRVVRKGYAVAAVERDGGLDGRPPYRYRPTAAAQPALRAKYQDFLDQFVPTRRDCGFLRDLLLSHESKLEE